MSEKFSFHGFFDQAESLEKSYKKYIGKSLSKTDLMNRLNIVKFLLCLSETPTVKFLEKPEEFEVNSTDNNEDQIDWKEYLNEGTEGWTQNFGSTSSEDVMCQYIDLLVIILTLYFFFRMIQTDHMTQEMQQGK